MAKNEKAVAKVDDKNHAVTEMPDFMRQTTVTGLEGLDSNDYVMPFIKLMQGGDDQVQTGAAAPGDFFHLTANKNIGKNLIFVPCFVRKRYMLFRPQESKGQSGSNILARADDGIHWSPANAEFRVRLKGKKEEVIWKTKPTIEESGLDKFGTMDPDDPQSKPAATLIYDIVAILPEYPELSPAIISLKGSSVQKAKKWYTTMRSMRAPIFGLLFSMYGTPEQDGGGNNYQAYNIKGEGFVKSPDLFKQSEELHKTLSVQNFRGDREDEPEDDKPTAAENKNY